MIKVYGDIYSGNCYKIKLLLSFLNIPHTWQHMDILAGETQTPEFLQKNSNGKIPLVELDSGEYLAESNAILNYFAEGSPYLPNDRLLRAQVLQWQFYEQYSHEPCIAVARYIQRYLGMPEHRRADYDSAQAGGITALQLMNTHLATHQFFVGERLTIADISLYAYTHVAEEGGFDLAPYNFISDWFARIEAHPNYIAMEG